MENSYTYGMEIAYNGTNYGGWQRQTNGTNSVQACVEDILRRIVKSETLCVSACSRTDAGVHALGMSCSFRTEKLLDEGKTFSALKNQLPHDIRLERLCLAEPGFHAHRNVLGKSYVYAVNVGYYSLFLKQGCWSWSDVSSVECLKDLLSLLVGRHDFRSFTGKNMEGENTERTLYRAEMYPFGPVVCFYFAGDGFLYKMVRRIVGALYETASGKRTAQSFREMVLHPQCPPDSITVAPPEGLYFKKAFYEEGQWESDSLAEPPFFC